MAKILIVLPYSGRGFGGGLAVFNADITKAFADQQHDVRLLTMDFGNPKINPDPKDHGITADKLLFIKDVAVQGMKDPGGASGENDRNTLYALFNKEEFLLQPAVKAAIAGKDSWIPEIIIGHSRFSGPAAIVLKEKLYPRAKALYFMHSYPVEGSALSGYEVYGEKLDTSVAQQKFDMEKAWMPRANLVVAVGPLIRSGVELILQEAKSNVRIHECIGGVNTTNKPVSPTDFPKDGSARLLFLGRASAPIKGLEGLVQAALELRDLPISIVVRYWDDRTFTAGVVTKKDVQDFIDGVLHTGAKIKVTLEDKTIDPAQEVRNNYHGLLMPSYIEHFGLVPFDALGNGVPVLVNEISGAGMFLGDTTRFGAYGPPCVVADFDAPHPLKPADYLQNVAPTAFDKRPEAWAAAIKTFVGEIPQRFEGAAHIYEVLTGYSWEDCARGIVNAIVVDPLPDKSLVTVQQAKGAITALK